MNRSTRVKPRLKPPPHFLKQAYLLKTRICGRVIVKGILKAGISQSILWPGLYKAHKKLYGEQLKYNEANTAALDVVIKRDVRTVFYQLWYLQDKLLLFHRLDSIYRSLNDAARLKVKTGDSPG